MYTCEIFSRIIILLFITIYNNVNNIIIMILLQDLIVVYVNNITINFLKFVNYGLYGLS